jgi:hypothetical protein
METTMVQCKLQKGIEFQTAWIEKKPGVKVGAIIELKSEKEGQQFGWEIKEMYSEMEQSRLNERSRDYLNTRKASDI